MAVARGGRAADTAGVDEPVEVGASEASGEPEGVRYALTLAYDGSGFHGWQHQEISLAGDDDAQARAGARLMETPRARWTREGDALVLRTVQSEVAGALRRLLREPSLTVLGASRTDTGVHAGGVFPDGRAGGQLAAFTTRPLEGRGVGWPRERGTDVLVRALNAALPRDVLCLGAVEVPVRFNPIRAARRKQYTYTIVSGSVRPLWDRDFVFHTWYELDADAMSAAAERIVGEHDFAGFAKVNHGRETTVRTVYECAVRAERDASVGGGHRVSITVSGSGFLYNMVRIIAGTLLEAGRGRVSADDVARFVEEADRRANSCPTLPPQGLRLDWIEWDPGVD